MRENAIGPPDLIKQRDRFALEQKQTGVLLVLNDGFDHLFEPLDNFFLSFAIIGGIGIVLALFPKLNQLGEVSDQDLKAGH